MYVVITTIAPPTRSVRKLVSLLSGISARLIVIGDEKGPKSFDTQDTTFFPLTEQLHMPFELARLLPTGHYARKNLGYLHSIANGAELIYETDDDNMPNGSWQPRQRNVTARVYGGDEWVSAYGFYSKELIWPRGLPLESIRRQTPLPSLGSLPLQSVDAPIQQGLANGAPDVDAVWRLLFDRQFDFESGDSLFLQPGSWCPFNSQSTWFWPDAYPLMYLPSYCSFRMTDIWRGFIAQRCLWAMEKGLVFHAAEVDQDRNPHQLIRDFEAEIPGYLGNARFTQTLNELELVSSPQRTSENLLSCYEALVREGFFPEKELVLVKAWISDLASVL
ncbi:MAG: DUF288 domain-containing protein [Gammaproteobacteria bacterium]|nr:DUF288 domain-containing protein [Gammaproteobacteria bacterium]